MGKDITIGNAVTNNYSNAVDRTARFLDDFGVSIGATYSSYYNDDHYECYVTLADPTKALRKLKELGCEIPMNDLLDFDINQIFDYICNGYIIYLNGYYPGTREGGHAWTVDGCVKIDRDPITGENPIEDGEEMYKYLHFDWGYGGRDNGWYTGAIYLQTSGHDYKPYQYFAGKINK